MSNIYSLRYTQLDNIFAAWCAMEQQVVAAERQLPNACDAAARASVQARVDQLQLEADNLFEALLHQLRERLPVGLTAARAGAAVATHHPALRQAAAASSNA